MLDGLDDVPWAELEHAYGAAEDVPGLLRQILVDDPKVRERVMFTLYGNVFHQGSRYPATPYVIPFLIEMCADPSVPGRGDLLRFWGSLITGYFSIQERPCWGDGERIHCEEEEDEEGEEEADPEDAYAQPLHAIYRESLLGFDLLIDLLADEEPGVRLGAAWVLACLPTRADGSAPRLGSRLADEPSGWVRAAIAFAETDPERALAAYRNACSINPAMAHRVQPGWHLASLLDGRGRG